MMWTRALVIFAACRAGGSDTPQGCTELAQFAPAGVTLGSNESECHRMLAFAGAIAIPRPLV